jgi:1,2-dihydroxy-3-keto-5-methylthiopentene dioxygenase
VSQLALYSQFNLQSPYKVSDDLSTLVAELAQDGIYFSQIPLLTMLPKAQLSGDQILQLYQPLVDEIKREHNYLYADVARLSEDDPFAFAVRSQYISEHTHKEDEARFFIEGAVLVYIHVNEKIHILECGPGDFLIIPKSVKHWMDIGPSPSFTSLRWYSTKDGLKNYFTGSCVAESTPRWETIYDEAHFKR